MADDAPVTFNDLPDDMLHEIFGHVFGEGNTTITVPGPPKGTHLALRSVCRRWRGVADWARLTSALIDIEANNVVDADDVRLRHPAAIKALSVSNSIVINLKSLVARSLVQQLVLINATYSPPFINLAELIVGGGGLPVLRELKLGQVVCSSGTRRAWPTRRPRPILRRARGSCSRRSPKW